MNTTLPASSTAAPDWLDRASALYTAILGRSIDEGARASLLAKPFDDDPDFALTVQLLYSGEFLAKLLGRSVEAHLFLMHRARQVMVRRLLPAAAAILDLGGINAPLFRMGYPHRFERMVIVDLPPDERHAAYRDIKFAAPDGSGEVSIHYGDMTSLEHFPDASFDFVWSGQSIEHVDPAGARRMCEGALRVLRPGGSFCLDTPNRAVTEIHTRASGGGMVHPDHKKEYRAAELRALLLEAGFSVHFECGICEMRNTRDTGSFDYQDFVLGNYITPDPEDGYILYFHGLKPAA